jgi:hypothetical protein
MNNDKKSSIEWLVEKIQQANPSFKFDALIKQAKEMHKEEIMDACLSNKTNHPVIKKLFEMQAEQYYNDTYKGGQDE